MLERSPRLSIVDKLTRGRAAQCVPDTCSMPCGPGRLDGWIAVRLRRRWGLSGADEYRGLRPGSKLVTTHKGQAFELAFKHRELNSGSEVYRACDSLQQAISRLYRQTGIKQGASHSGRRSLAAKVLAATGDVETVQTILGHSCLDHSKPYLSVDQLVIRRAFELAL